MAIARRETTKVGGGGGQILFWLHFQAMALGAVKLGAGPRRQVLGGWQGL